jgi:hypothetical protein
VTTHATFGHSFIAAPRNSSSGPVYPGRRRDQPFSLGSADIVAAPCRAEPADAGVSTSTKPLEGCAAVISA